MTRHGRAADITRPRGSTPLRRTMNRARVRAPGVCALLIAVALADVAWAQAQRLNVGGCDIRRGALCTNKNLNGAVLSGADLRNSQFSRTVLSGADLRRANLNEANFSATDLRGADLRAASLLRTNLRGARLAGANLGGADLRDAMLQNADLSNADLSGAQLEEADLTNARLNGARLHDADLRRVNLRAAIVTAGLVLTPGLLLYARALGQGRPLAAPGEEAVEAPH